jgi:hypothetical protein
MILKFYYVTPGVNDRGEQVLFWQGSFEGDKGKKERYERYICNTLPAVAQTDRECKRLLSYIEMAGRGEGEYETGGNDVTLSITKAGVQVDIEANEDWVGQEEGFFSLADWHAAVAGWQRFIKMDCNLESSVNVEL